MFKRYLDNIRKEEELKYREKMVSFMQEMDELKNKLNEEQKIIAKLMEDLEKKDAKIQVDEELITNLRKESDQLEKEIGHLKEEQKELTQLKKKIEHLKEEQKEVARLKHNLEGKDAKIQADQKLIAKLTQEFNQLKEEIKRSKKKERNYKTTLEQINNKININEKQEVAHPVFRYHRSPQEGNLSPINPFKQ